MLRAGIPALTRTGCNDSWTVPDPLMAWYLSMSGQIVRANAGLMCFRAFRGSGPAALASTMCGRRHSPGRVQSSRWRADGLRGSGLAIAGSADSFCRCYGTFRRSDSACRGETSGAVTGVLLYGM